MYFNYPIFRPIVRALSIQKRSEIVKNEHAQYTLERFPTDNARVVCIIKGIGTYSIMYANGKLD
jgi:tartrate dehydratase alpha subunit/fumarate hydratase class I-like protein